MFPGPSQMEIPGPNTRNGSRVAGALEAGQAVGMAEQHPDHRPETGPETGPEAQGAEKLTVFGEPLWVDALKTLGVALAMLLGTVAVGAVLGIMIMAPWGRASPECSIYCVLEQQLEAFFSDQPS